MSWSEGRFWRKTDPGADPDIRPTTVRTRSLDGRRAGRMAVKRSDPLEHFRSLPLAERHFVRARLRSSGFELGEVVDLSAGYTTPHLRVVATRPAGGGAAVPPSHP